MLYRTLKRMIERDNTEGIAEKIERDGVHGADRDAAGHGSEIKEGPGTLRAASR